MFLDNDRVSVKRLLGKFLVIDRMVQEILVILSDDYILFFSCNNAANVFASIFVVL